MRLPFRLRRWWMFLQLAAGAGVAASDGDAGPAFDRDIAPLLRTYCLECHSAETRKGEVDLERFRSAADVIRDPGVWERVLEQLELAGMPPPRSPQPSEAEKTRLRGWIDAALEKAAEARAGDPGPVVLRRLNNAEYTYTIRDLTGVQSLDPADTFPADSAAGEGFMNVGQALVMSPSLVTKYLDAAKLIASHAVLLPDGIGFSEAASRHDWTHERLEAIREFYARHTEPGVESSLNLQEIRVDTRDGGVIPLERYLEATIAHRDRMRCGPDAVAAVARESGLSGRYLGLLWDALHEGDPSPLLDALRERWKAARPGDGARLAEDIRNWQGVLWKFEQVGHIGKRGGPVAWQVPISPVAERHEIRLKLPAGERAGSEVRIRLAASPVIGGAGDTVVWEQVRFTAGGQPDLAAKDAGAVVEGRAGGSSEITLEAPGWLEIRVPRERVEGREFVATARLGGDDPSRAVQVWASPGEPGALEPGFDAGRARPVLAVAGGEAHNRLQQAFDAFRKLFPAAVCYTRIVPVDEVVTLTLHYREDHLLRELMLEEAEIAELDRLWEELRYVSQDALKLVDAFEQLWQYATQDADPSVFTPMREPIHRAAEEFRRRLVESEPAHVDAAIRFAARAWRRPLTRGEEEELRAFHAGLRGGGIEHEESIRLMLARILVSPAFLYRIEAPVEGDRPGPVNDWELATRLSYFLWSSAPDDELRAEAAAGRLRDPEIASAQARRMLKDPKVRRMAIEFACAWLHVYDFDELGEKSELTFPEFQRLRGAMYEETIRFFTGLFTEDRSVLEILDSDHTFVNEDLARHYGLEDVKFEDGEWRRVDGVKAFGRGGILGHATILAKHSGASRTSPILRGNWLSEVLLGEPLPRPPPNVPTLPEDEAALTLTMRELTERHSSDPLCAGCHRRIDPYGFALEAFDAIGRFRRRDAAGREIDTRSLLMDGTEVDGLEGLRAYLLTRRRDQFLEQFCRKLLGYALGRGVLLSDRPLIREMRHALESGGFRVSRAIDTIVRSPQFREIRGRDMAAEE